MIKDHTRDYVIAAFRLYASMGKPSHAEAKDKIYKQALNDYADIGVTAAITQAEKAVDVATPVLLDIMAVDKTMELLGKGGKGYIAAAVNEIYFYQPSRPLLPGEISNRVRRFSLLCPTDDRTVYRWLKEARLLCAAIRGLRISSKDVQRYHIAL